MITLLGFGTSHRRGQQGWMSPDRPRFVLDTLQPDATVDGASPSGGADDIFHWQARAHFIARGLDPDLARRCPMDPAKDGPHGFKNRNGRMHRTYRPSLAAAFISGEIGSPMTAGSAHMLGICLAAKTPVVVYRDNGVEPHAHLGVALSQLRRLYARDGSRWAPWIEAIEATVEKNS